MRLQLCTLLAMLLASAFTGAAITMVVYQVIISNVRREVELGSERLLEMQSELDEIQVQILRVNHLMRARAGSNGGLNGPNYTHIDQVIDDPPNDTAARSLYYELAYDILYTALTCT